MRSALLLCELVKDARGREVSVREIPCAFDGQEGEETLYQFAERIQGLLDVADGDDPRFVAELEEAVRISLTTRRSLAGVDDLYSGWRFRPSPSLADHSAASLTLVAPRCGVARGVACVLVNDHAQRGN
jgi:hypothetical protein